MTANAPLAGVRVLEMSQAIAGPTCGLYLAHLGAEVIKVDNFLKPDVVRLMGAPWLPPETHILVRGDTGMMGGEFNGGKLSLGVNPASSDGRQILEDLIRVSDAFLINYSASAIKSLNLRYEDVREVREDIVYCGVPGFGYTEGSPYFTYKSWGPNQSPIAGLDHLTGWADRPPTGIGSFSYPDYSGGAQAALAILAALLHRDVTGEGQHIDLSQMEVALSAIGPWIIEESADHPGRRPDGNRVPWAAPHDVFPCRGRERWVAVSCHTDEEWEALCSVAKPMPFVSDPHFRTLAGRLDNADALYEEIAGWTVGFTNRDLAMRLQAAGVPAAVASDQSDLIVDPQLESRQSFFFGDHYRLGKAVSNAIPARLSLTPSPVSRGLPAMAEDNDYVLGQLLGIDAEERSRLASVGAIFETLEPDTRFQAPFLPWVGHFLRLDWPQPR